MRIRERKLVVRILKADRLPLFQFCKRFSKSEEGTSIKKRKTNDGDSRDSPLGSSLKAGNQEGSRVSEDFHPKIGCDRSPPFPHDLNHDSPILNIDKEHPSNFLAVARNTTVDNFKMQKFFFHEINEIKISIYGVNNKLDNLMDPNLNLLEKEASNMVVSLQKAIKDIEHMKEDFEGRIMRLGMNYKKINDNLVTLFNFSYKVIKSSVESIRFMIEKFERAQEAKSFFIDIWVFEKGKYWSATTTHAQLEKTNQSIRDIRTSLGFAVNLDVHQNTKEILRTATVRLEESPLKLLDFEPVGIDTRVEEVKSLLDMDGTEPALAVVLCDFGGVGKSTLAASVIQNLYQTQSGTCAGFKFCRVIINDKTADEITHVKQLQRDIISDFGGGRQDLRNPEEGCRRLRDLVENKWCLLFIDNVVDKKYVQKLLPKDLKWFNKSENMLTENLEKPKSKLRIIITSREKNLRPEFNITCKEYDIFESNFKVPPERNNLTE
ncbi:hypothetical protein SUGI_1101070 [Cryptomeria japonica]|nr:hypothetical protein SUGI_1101070 [Cryptomeria japonica]